MHFIPELPGWGHPQDRIDVAAMLDGGLVERDRLRELFEAIADQLPRYPAIEPSAFRRAVEARLGLYE